MNRCIYRDDNSHCAKLSDEEVMEYCVEGPCPHEGNWLQQPAEED